MTDTTLPTEPRPTTGKGIARKARAKGLVPGVLYSAGAEATPLAFEPKKLLDIFRRTKNRNTIVELQVGEGTVSAIVQEVQRHPVSRDLLHVDFYALAPGREVVVKVPVDTVGKAAGLGVGGRIRIITRELTVRCAYDLIPATIEIDVTELDVGQFLRASQVKVADGVTVVFDNDFNVIACEGKPKAGA